VDIAVSEYRTADLIRSVTFSTGTTSPVPITVAPAIFLTGQAAPEDF
jgi:hypothetical protein